jgi:hypothetical protein
MAWLPWKPAARARALRWRGSSLDAGVGRGGAGDLGIDSPHVERGPGRAGRRVVLVAVGALAVAAVVAHGVGGASPSGHSPPLPTVRIDPRVRGVPVAPSFLGLSIEHWALTGGEGLGAPNPVLVALVRKLASGGGAAQLRIGGRSTERTWWPAGGKRKPPWVQSVLTPGWVRTLGGLADATGSRVVVGLNMAADDPALAAREAAGIARVLPRGRLQAFELGNEPDLYSSVAWYAQATGGARRLARFARARYGLAGYLRDAQRFAVAVRGWVPGARFAGPGFITARWMGALTHVLARARRWLVEVTLHRYPLRACFLRRDDRAAPTIAHLLGDRASAGLARALAPAVADARSRGLPLRIDELNSVACRGRAGVSDTFAATLWGLDTLLELARVGVAGVNVHTRGLSTYSPLSFVRTRRGWAAHVEPLYYAMLLFARLTPRGARVVRPAVPRGADVKVWVVRGPGRRLRVVVIDKDRRARGAVRLRVTGQRRAAGVMRLGAPAVTSTAPPRLGGQTFGRLSYDARLHGRAIVSRVQRDPEGAYPVPFTRPGIAVVTFGPPA